MPDRPTSSFSRSMAAALRGYVRERAILQSDVAERIERSEGFVSARLTGRRPPDTDMIDAIASLAGISTARLYEELGRRLESPAPDPPPPSEVVARHVKKARADVADESKATKSAKPPHRRSRGA